MIVILEKLSADPDKMVIDEPGEQAMSGHCYPNKDLSIASLSVDINANWSIEAVKWRITNEVLGEID